MMKNKSIVLLLVCCWSACSKQDVLPPNGQEPPYFSVTYSADGLSQKVVAGLSNAYLFTDFSTGADDVVTCTGTFADVQCQDDVCPGRLRFEFRNRQIGSVVLADTAFKLGEYVFTTSEPQGSGPGYLAIFKVKPVQGYADFHWDVDDQYTATDSIAVFDFPLSTDSVLVTLQATHSSGVVSTVRRRVSLAAGTSFLSADILILPQGGFYRLNALISGIYTGLDWNTGSIQPSFIQDTLQSVYSLTVNDSSENVAFASLDGLPAGLTDSLRTVNFTSSVSLLPTDTLQLGAVAIQWTDPQGHVWRSDKGPQEPGLTTFQVLESLPYELNEKGQKTWQMRVSFACRLYRDGQSMPFSGEGRIAVAYPGG